MSSDPLSAKAREPARPALDTIEGRARADASRRRLRWLLPLLALAAALLVVGLLFATRPVAERREPESLIPSVRVVPVVAEDRQVTIVAHGTVAPRTESDLVAEVRGRVMEVAPELVAGGFFAEGDVLLRLDAREHEIAVDRARAAVAQRRSEAKLADADAARRRALADRGAASAADLEQVEARALGASAGLAEARATLAQAQLDRERTVLRAPFDGRVRARAVDVGQFVNPGEKLARLFSVDYAEVRLPVSTDDVGLLDVPLGAGDADQTPPVTLSARVGGVERRWQARLVRSEAEIDARTRMLHVVARVDDPYARSGGHEAPLPSGLFVRAEIAGQALDRVIALPAVALREGDQVYLVDEESRIVLRSVEVLRRERDEVLIGAGLEGGERVVVSPMRFATDGMPVRLADSEAP